MKKKLGVIVLSLVLAMSCIGFAVVSAAGVGETDQNWTTSGSSGTTAVVAEDGYTRIGKLDTWGDRAGYNYGVVLDGFEISVKNSNLASISSGSDMYSGIVFGARNGYVSDAETCAVTLSMWKQFGQGRLYFQYSHNPSGAKMNIYTQKDTSSAPLGMADGCLVFSSANDEFTVRFTLEEDGQWYKVEIIGSGMGAFADVNTGFSSGTNTATGYVPVSLFGDFISDEGEIYLTVVGFKGGEAPESIGFDIKISDDNTRAYETVLATAAEKTAAYDTAAAAVADESAYDAAIAARTDAVSYISQNVRSADKADYLADIAAADAKIAGNDTAEAFAKADVNETIMAAKSLTDAFAKESNITEDALAAAKTAVDSALAKVADYRSLVKEGSFTELETAVNAVAYDNDKANVTIWFIGIEAQIAALDTASETIGADIAAVKAVRSGWNTSEAKALYDKLKEEDKQAFDTRLAAVDVSVAEAEEGADSQVKESYLAALEAALSEDLTVKENLDAAIAEHETLDENVVISETDGELYTRYTAARQELTAACENFVTSAINAASEALDAEITKYSEYAQIVKEFETIDLDYVNEESENYATILAAYDALEDKLEANEWYYIGEEGINEISKTADGLYFEMSPDFPNRFNYNKPLTFEDEGVDIVIELTHMAYYNGDTTEDGVSKGANNLSINFLLEPDSYKSKSRGINIVIWLFETESSVDINDMSDKSIAHSVLATPINGGKLSINVKHGDYFDFVGQETYPAWQITINNALLVVRDTQFENAGIAISGETPLYFSLGSFADYREDTNDFTIVSIDGVSFAEENPGGSENPGGTEDPGKDPEETQKGGCNSSVTVSCTVIGAVLLAAAGCILAMLRKRKE